MSADKPAPPVAVPDPEVWWMWTRLAYGYAYELKDGTVPNLETRVEQLETRDAVREESWVDQWRRNTDFVNGLGEVQERVTLNEGRLRDMENAENRRQGKQTASLAIVMVVMTIVQSVAIAFIIKKLVGP